MIVSAVALGKKSHACHWGLTAAVSKVPPVGLAPALCGFQERPARLRRPVLTCTDPTPGRLAGNHLGRNRSGGLDQTDQLPHRSDKLRDRHLPLPPPASPEAPGRSACTSTRPGGGPPRSAKNGNDFGPPSPDYPADQSTPTQGNPVLKGSDANPPPATAYFAKIDAEPVATEGMRRMVRTHTVRRGDAADIGVALLR